MKEINKIKIKILFRHLWHVSSEAGIGKISCKSGLISSHGEKRWHYGIIRRLVVTNKA
jgi:hypothetical protein